VAGFFILPHYVSSFFAASGGDFFLLPPFFPASNAVSSFFAASGGGFFLLPSSSPPPYPDSGAV
jgi:hypothetical protein